MYLQIEADKCTGCRICENYCSFHHEGVIWPARSRVVVVADALQSHHGHLYPGGGLHCSGDVGPFVLRVCRQCGDGPCAAACPAEAIARDQRTGAWVVDVELCLGCGSCADACPYDAIVLDAERGVALKCDLCAGSPECAAMCPAGAIIVKRKT